MFGVETVRLRALNVRRELMNYYKLTADSQIFVNLRICGYMFTKVYRR
jgi:hypothetical protein